MVTCTTTSARESIVRQAHLSLSLSLRWFRTKLWCSLFDVIICIMFFSLTSLYFSTTTTRITFYYKSWPVQNSFSFLVGTFPIRFHLHDKWRFYATLSDTLQTAWYCSGWWTKMMLSVDKIANKLHISAHFHILFSSHFCTSPRCSIQAYES